MVDQDWSKGLTTGERMRAWTGLNAGQSATKIHFDINLKRHERSRPLVDIGPLLDWLDVLTEYKGQTA